MAFEGFPNNSTTFKTDAGLIYTSVFFPRPASSDRATILFLHGFPSSSYDWHNQITFFARKGYGVIAPDLLGYGGSSAPESLEAYIFKNIADDVVGLLAHCNINIQGGDKVHVVGHDFGSIFMGTLLGYYPNLALTASFLAIPYTPPGRKVDMEIMKRITESHLGFELFGYRRFLMRENSWKTLSEHKESFFLLAYGQEEDVISDFLPPGKLEAFITADKKLPWNHWVTKEYKETRDRIFAKDNAYKGPTDWYRARFRDFLGIDQELNDIEADPRISCPTLFLQSGKTKLSTDKNVEGTKVFTEIYEYKNAEHAEGHFLQLEAPDEVNQILENFFVEHSRFRPFL